MQGKEVGIEEVLFSREKRVKIQNEMIKKYNFPIISFTMNIPGPIKINQDIKIAFNYGKEFLLKKLNENKIEILEVKELDENTGSELLISANANVQNLKDIAVFIEESEDIGRLFDIDVIDINFEKISRSIFRKCFICDLQAQECGRSRKHSIEELQKKIDEILKNFKNSTISQ